LLESAGLVDVLGERAILTARSRTVADRVTEAPAR